MNATAPAATPLSVHSRAVGCCNAGDVEGFADLHAPDAVLVTPAGTFRGRAAIRRYCAGIRAAFPDLTLRVGLAVEQGDTVVAEWAGSGSNTGPMALPDGTSRPATGRAIAHRGMQVAHVRAGRIVEHHIYWDRLATARQLGLTTDPDQLPAPGADRRRVSLPSGSWMTGLGLGF